MTTISSFYCCEKGFILMKYHFLKKKIFTYGRYYDADYAYGKIVYKGFEIKNLGEYHDLYVQSDTLLLADVFANFRNMF